MGRRRGSPEGLQTDVLKALGGLDTLNRQSGTSRRRLGSDAPAAAPERVSSTNAVEPKSEEPGYRSDAVLATFAEEEPDTQRFVSSGQVVAAKPSDRRAARRVPLVVPVVMHVEGVSLEGTAEDVSISGIFVRTSRLLQSGKRVHVRFDMPGGEIEAMAIVVRFRTPARGLSGGIGLCFEGLSEALSLSIETFCESSDSVR